MTISSLMNAAMTEQMRNTLLAVDQPIRISRPHIPTTPRAAAEQHFREVVDMIVESPLGDAFLKHKATDLAEGTNTADTFIPALKAGGETAITALKNAQLTPEQKDTFIKICKDGLREGQKPGPADREVYSQLLKDPDSLTNAKATHVQDDDILEALTSFDEKKSDAAFRKVDARFRMNPDIDPNNMALTIANTFKNAERNGKVGSLVGKKQKPKTLTQ